MVLSASKFLTLIGLVGMATALLAELYGLPWTKRMLAEDIRVDSGFAFIHPLNVWPDLTPYDSESGAFRSPLVLSENGQPLGPAHVSHADIRREGRGRYSHWNQAIWFSASDNSDPRSNGRVYEARFPITPPKSVVWGAVLLGGLLVALGTWPRTMPVSRIRSISFKRDALIPVAMAAATPPLWLVGDGVWLWAGLGFGLGAVVTSAQVVLHAAFPNRCPPLGKAPSGVVLVTASVTLGLIAGELLIVPLARPIIGASKAATATFRSPSPPPPALLAPEAAAAIKARSAVVVMPKEWERRPVAVLGAQQAYYWHGVLHVYDSLGMRRTAPIPPKAKGVARILVYGDSLTYGEGVDERFTYASLIGQELAKTHAVEVVNLGVNGAQSADILETMRKLTAKLDGDIVIYGICLNDFLPSGVSQYTGQDAWAFPLPAAIRDRLVSGTGLGRFLNDSYDRVLRSLHLRNDFIDDILENSKGMQDRFGEDLRRMNQLTTGLGLPPVVTMVLHQLPVEGGRAEKLAELAETLAGKAGLNVIQTRDFFHGWSGKTMRVSLWEGHPDEEAHAVFAEMFLARLRAMDALRTYRRDAGM